MTDRPHPACLRAVADIVAKHSGGNPTLLDVSADIRAVAATSERYAESDDVKSARMAEAFTTGVPVWKVSRRAEAPPQADPETLRAVAEAATVLGECCSTADVRWFASQLAQRLREEARDAPIRARAEDARAGWISTTRDDEGRREPCRNPCRPKGSAARSPSGGTGYWRP